MRNSLRYTAITEEGLTNATTQPLFQNSRQILKRISTEKYKAHRTILYPELTEGFNYTSVHPLLGHSSLRIDSFIKWLVVSTCVLADRKHSDHSWYQMWGLRFRIYRNSTKLTDKLPSNRARETTMSQNVTKNICEKTSGVQSLTDNSKRNWIPAGEPWWMKKNSSITQGESVRPMKNMNDPLMYTDAYDEYIIILSSLEERQIRIYTDGGHSPDSKSTGFGIE